MFGKEKLVFDPADADATDNVGAYVRSSDGTLITHTDNGGKQSLDVNVSNTVTVEATDFDIRNLDYSQDNVAIKGATGNQLVVEADGSINVNADISVVNGHEKLEDAAHVSGDVGSFVLAVRQDTLANSVSADGNYAAFKVNSKGALYVEIAQQSPATNTSWLVSQNTIDTTAELVVATDLAARKRILIQNVSSSKVVYLGESNAVTSASGLRLSAGAAIELDLAAGAAIYAIANGAGADIRVAELAG